MFVAVNENGDKVAIEEALKNVKYICPKCNHEVIYKQCKMETSHFAHKINSNCIDWGDMSEWHLNWQKNFPLDAREAVMEANGEKHRADVFIKSKNTIIEFRQSYISADDFYKRNMFYFNIVHANIKVYYLQNIMTIESFVSYYL